MNWNDSDRFTDSELASLEHEWPEQGSERHRFISTIKHLQECVLDREDALTEAEQAKADLTREVEALNRALDNLEWAAGDTDASVDDW